jgi:hypothetical protein
MKRFYQLHFLCLLSCLYLFTGTCVFGLARQNLEKEVQEDSHLKQKIALKASLNDALYQYQGMYKRLDEQLRQCKFFQEYYYAALLKRSRAIEKKYSSVQAQKALLAQKQACEAKLIDAIRADDWARQSELRTQAESLRGLVLLSHEVLSKRDAQLKTATKNLCSLKQNLADLQKAISESEVHIKSLSSQAQQCARQILQDPHMKTEKLS